MRMRFSRSSTSAAALVLATAMAAAGPAPGDERDRATIFDLVFRPVRGGGPEVTAIEVRGELRGGAPPADETFSVQAPITYASVTGIADRIEQLQLKDASGVVPLTIEEDAVNPGGFPYYRHWRAGRQVVYPAVLTFRSIPQATPPTPGPVFSFRSHGGGISTAGSGFLALPETTGTVTMRLHWDLSHLAPGSIVASTFGEGDVEVKGEPKDLLQGYYMAGPLGRYAPAEAKGTFFGYWLGRPAFDPEKEMAWGFRTYVSQQTFFRETAPRPYRVFVRALPQATRRLGGTALQNSFMLAVPEGGADPAVESPRETIAHEMSHMFVGGIAGGPPSGSPWFAEGLNVHYTRLVLLRSGLAPVSDYEKSINETARRYYANRFRNESAESLDRIGFSAGVGDGGAQNVPYTRGSLYFATVDFRIREASGGKRTLDDVVLPLFDRRRRGQPFDRDELIEAFVKEYGPSARSDFESVIVRGETIVPPPGAFGPCLDRRPAKLTVQEREADGYEWFRVTSVPDEQCRQW
jgi:hypothetical protein